jgi:hypothetical protein
MGWDFTRGATKQDIIERLIREQTFPSYHEPGTTIHRKTIAHKDVGGVLWSVIELTKTKDNQSTTERIIGCDLLARNPGYGWGYKGLQESSGPYFYSCPLEYLDMVPDVKDAEWRAEVRKLNHDGKYRDDCMAP